MCHRHPSGHDMDVFITPNVYYTLIYTCNLYICDTPGLHITCVHMLCVRRVLRIFKFVYNSTIFWPVVGMCMSTYTTSYSVVASIYIFIIYFINYIYTHTCCYIVSDCSATMTRSLAFNEKGSCFAYNFFHCELEWKYFAGIITFVKFGYWYLVSNAYTQAHISHYNGEWVVFLYRFVRQLLPPRLEVHCRYPALRWELIEWVNTNLLVQQNILNPLYMHYYARYLYHIHIIVILNIQNT